MASFLQNHGDIILDAVLTDYGRRLLAKGDGSFRISKFALADDEIDYSLYDTELSTDNKIMETPIMEAITNNAASVKCPLLSFSIENILFMPTLLLNQLFNQNTTGSFGDFSGFIVPVDNSNIDQTKTSRYLTSSTNVYLPGVLNNGMREIIVDHGIDSEKLSNKENLRNRYQSMYETQFNVYTDNRFCNIGKNSNSTLYSIMPLSVDDDGVAVYRITDLTTVGNMGFVSTVQDNDTQTPIRGTKGTRVSFTLVPNLDLSATDSMFLKYGKLITFNGNQYHSIRSYVTIEGITTGCSVDVPILFVKIKL